MVGQGMKKSYSLVLSTINGVLYLVAIGLWLSIPDERWLCLSTTLFALALSLFLMMMNWNEVVVYLRSQWFKKVTASLISLFLIFCILSLLNYLSYKTPKTWDFNFAKLNSLSKQTLQVVDSVEGPLEFIVFASRDQIAPIRALTELYRYQKADITIRIIDPEVRPDLVAQFEITRSNVIVVKSGERRELVSTLNELNITNAILRLSRTHDPLLCFTSGRGEKGLSDQSPEGLLNFSNLLTQSSYRVQELLLSTLVEVPADCQVLAVIAPELSYRADEIEMIQEYLSSGRGLLLALGPNLNEDRHERLRELLERWGLYLSNDLVIDRRSHVSGSNGTIPLISEFLSDHPIIRGLQGMVFFPLTSSIEFGDRPDIDHYPLIATSSFPHSWAERSPQSLVDGTLQFNEGVDLPGPVLVMAAAENSRTQGRIVALGNGTLIHNNYANYGMNNLLVMNALSWLTREERLIAFDSPLVKDEPIFINSHQLGLIFYFSVIFAPLFLLLIAFVAYRRRARL
jgi:ABC-type uncharacterized transport system involved in gliding motility auxiliary subunit